MPFQRLKMAGFSLVEVVLAIGIFVVVVSVMLGLLPSLTRQSNTSNDLLTASHLPDALRTELQRMAISGGLDSLAVQTKPLAFPLPDTCLLVAARDASRLHALSYQTPPVTEQLSEGSQYFLIEVWSFNTPPLSFETHDAVLPLHIRVSWPYRLPGLSSATSVASREQLGFNLVLNR